MGWAQVVDVERKINENLSQKSSEIKEYIAQAIDNNVRLAPSQLMVDDIITSDSEYAVKFKRSGIITLYVSASTSYTNRSHTVSVSYSKNGSSPQVLSVTINTGFNANYGSTNIEVSRDDVVEVKPESTSSYVELKFSLRAKVELKNGIAEEIYE